MDFSINSASSKNPLYNDCDTRKKKKRIGASWCTLGGLATVLFACTAVLGQLTQYVCLPLWLDSTSTAITTNKTQQWKPTIDNYFVLSFASLAFVVIFGCVILITDIICPKYFATTDWTYRFLLMKIGFIQGVAALFIVFPSSGTRTPPYLQAILGNFSIPITLAFRFVFLKKIPTRRKLISAMAVVASLFICLIPTIFPGVDPHSAQHLGGARGAGRILWPLTFMLGFAVTAIAFIVEEKAVKMQEGSHTRAGLVSILFWTSLSQFLMIMLLFWTDFIPGFGQVKNIHEFSQNWWFGLQCVFGGAGCSSTPTVLAFLFIIGYVMALFGSALLLRYSEGATLLAIVLSLCTPLGFIFWTLFEEKPFQWHPKVYVTSWFSIAALIIMVPAAFIYNTGPPEREKSCTPEREQVSPMMCDAALPATQP